MSVFNLLGTAVSGIPKLVNDTATAVTQFVEQNFDIPGKARKVAEMGSRIVAGGQGSNFSGAMVNASGFDTTAMYGRDKRETMSANLFPGTNAGKTDDFKVVLRQDDDGGAGPFEFVFTVMPRIDESRSVDYEAVTPIHHPGAIQKYRNTGTRSWRISGRLMSRTMSEASTNMRMLNLVRSWMMPYYGEGTGQSAVSSKLGAPPPVLTLKAYGDTMIGPVKCVLKDANWTFDNTLDYITTLEGNPFPVLLDINISLEESWSPAEFSGFNLELYKQGILGEQGAFKKSQASPAPAVLASVPAEKSEAAAKEAYYDSRVIRDEGIRSTADASELLRESRRGLGGGAKIAPVVPKFVPLSEAWGQFGGNQRK